MLAVLRDARDLLARDGWCQGSYGPSSPDAHGRRCVRGAVEAAAPTVRSLSAAYSALQTTLGTRYIACWNDSEDRQVEEVFQLFDDTIARLESA